jgi:hypothetical protein
VTKDKWYTLNKVVIILGMDPRVFRRLIRDKVFPVGVVRPGEKQPKWSSRDLKWMQQRMAMEPRFTGQIREPKER